MPGREGPLSIGMDVGFIFYLFDVYGLFVDGRHVVVNADIGIGCHHSSFFSELGVESEVYKRSQELLVSYPCSVFSLDEQVTPVVFDTIGTRKAGHIIAGDGMAQLQHIPSFSKVEKGEMEE